MNFCGIVSRRISYLGGYSGVRWAATGSVPAAFHTGGNKSASKPKTAVSTLAEQPQTTAAVKWGNGIISRRSMSSGNHVTLWTAERVVSGALVPILPMALIMPCAPLDYLLAFGLMIHSHWGIEAIVVDYVRPSVFGEAIPKIALAMVYGLSAMTLGGLFYFIYADVGIGNAIRMLWKL